MKRTDARAVVAYVRNTLAARLSGDLAHENYAEIEFLKTAIDVPPPPVAPVAYDLPMSLMNLENWILEDSPLSLVAALKLVRELRTVIHSTRDAKL